jgi:hypothetical protein
LGSLGGIELDVLVSNSGDVAQFVDERTPLRG